MTSETPTSPKKVVILATEIPPYRDYFFREVSKLITHPLTVLSSGNTGTWEDVSGYNCKPSSSIVLVRNAKSNLGFEEEKRRVIPLSVLSDLYREKPNLVVSMNFGIRSLFALFYCRLTGIPLVLWTPLSELSESGRGRIRHLFRKLLVKSSYGIIVNGESGERYVKKLESGNKRIFKIPYCTDNRVFENPDVFRDESFRYDMLTVGQIIARKGILEFANILGKYLENRPGQVLTWTLVGGGYLEDKLIGQDLHPRLRLSIKSHVSYERLARFYKTHGIFVLPSLCDEWGVVVNEAMASGLPVLGSIYSGAVNELVEDGVTGWCFNPSGDIEVNCQLLEGILNNRPEELENMGKQAVLRIRDFDCRPVARKFVELLNNTICENTKT